MEQRNVANTMTPTQAQALAKAKAQAKAQAMEQPQSIDADELVRILIRCDGITDLEPWHIAEIRSYLDAEEEWLDSDSDEDYEDYEDA